MIRLATALPMLFVAALASAAAQTQVPALDVAPMPAHWVPFSATMEIVRGSNRWVGRFYRGADGSIRSETGRAAGPVESILINNYTDGMKYVFSRRTGWSSGLVERPPAWPKPHMMSGRFYRSLAKSEVPFEGLDVLVRVTPDATELFAPQLNGFVIDVREKACAECGIHFRNFKLEDQPASLFQPDPPA
jgi:hypothetical protein